MKKNQYITILQSQINTDIQAVKSGALDEELLRARLVDNADQNNPVAQLTLWLCALRSNLIDDLEVVVQDSENGPQFLFFPQFESSRSARTPVLKLLVPGPEQDANPLQEPAGQTQQDEAQILIAPSRRNSMGT